MVQPVVPALVTANENEPVPDPPVALSVRLMPAVAVVVEIDTADAWAMRFTVTVVSADVAASKFASSALVARTVHVPPLVKLSVDPVTEHPAVPAETSANVTAPVPCPPDVVSVSGVPKFAEVEVTVIPAPAPPAS